MNCITKMISNYIPRPYVAKDAIRILNVEQASFYWDAGVQPVDIYPSKNRKTGKPCIVFAFIREEQKDIYDEWVKQKERSQNDE